MGTVTRAAALFTLAAAGCGGKAVIYQDGGPPQDASVSDVTVEAGGADEGSTGLVPCPHGALQDCVAQQACVDGYCCIGDHVIGGECRCGDGLGCDVQHYCCTYPDAGPHCASTCPPGGHQP